MASTTPAAGLERTATAIATPDARAASAILGPVFDQYSMATIVVAPDPPRWTVLLVNAAYLAATGRRREELVGRGLFEAFPESMETTQEHGALRISDSLERAMESLTPDVLPLQRYDLQGGAGADGAPLFETHFWQMTTRPVLSGDARRVIALAHEVADVTAHAEGRRERRRLSDELAARTLEAERARWAAEEARRRIAFLADVSERLAFSGDLETTLRTVAELAVPTLGNWCFVEMRTERGEIRPIAIVHEDPARVAFAAEVLRRYPIDPDAPFGTGHVLRTGEPELTPELTEEMLRSVAQDDEHLRLLRDVGFRSSLSMPLSDTNGRAVAVLSIVSTEPGRAYGAADLALVQEVARRASAAIASARLRAAESSALQRATVLQRVTAALSSALTMQEAATVVVEQSTATLGALGGVVVRPTADGRRLEIVRLVGYPEDARQQWKEFSIDAPLPLAEAARTRRPVFLESAQQWVQRYGDKAQASDASPSASWAAFPLMADGRVLGAMGLSFAREHALNAEDQALAIALAQQCAQAFERARLFDAEREARAAAEAANRSKSEFLSTMSHELRTPLNAIGGYVQLMEMGLRGPVTDDQRDALNRIQRSQNHLLGLINEVLNYARLESGRVTYDLADTDVAQVIASAVPLIEPQRAEKRISLVVPEWESAQRVRMHADPEKLEQILLNLLSNAVKFTQPDGRVTVALRAGEPSSGVALLQVTDTGIGIAADKLEAIFEPFVQVGRTFSNPREGTGLGLAISRDLARGMGGDLTVQSAPGEGSTFTLTLPLAAD